MLNIENLDELERKAAIAPWTWSYPDEREGADIQYHPDGYDPRFQGYDVITRDSGVYGPDVDTCEFIMAMRNEARRLIEIAKAARDFVEDREEATENIWYCNGEKGRALLEALGIPYVEKG